MIRIHIEREFIAWWERHQDPADYIFSDWSSFLISLNSDCLISLNCGPKEMAEDHGLFLRLLSNHGSPRIQYNVETQDLIQSMSPCPDTIYFMAFLKNESRIIMDKVGTGHVESFSPDNFRVQWEYYLSPLRNSCIPVNQSGFNSWSELGKIKHKVHSLIVVDPYLIKLRVDEIENNLTDCIKAFLDMNVPHLVSEVIIVSKEFDADSDFANKRHRAFWERLVNSLENYEGLCISLYLYKKNSPDHFRTIITPYWLINSGNSFQFFNANGRLRDNVADSISFFCTFTKQCRTTLDKYLDYILKYIKSASDDSPSGIVKRRFTNSIEYPDLPRLITDHSFHIPPQNQ